LIIKDSSSRIIQQLKAGNLTQGLNYVQWRLDEQMHRLPGAWVSEESRGISVLAGTYTAELTYNDYSTSSKVEVINDPRFVIDEAVEQELYAFNKQLDYLVARFAEVYNRLTAAESSLEEDSPEKSLAKKWLLEGRDRPVDRQVGAWQSTKRTPHKVLSGLLKIGRARTQPISDQEYARLEVAEREIDNYVNQVEAFLKRLE